MQLQQYNGARFWLVAIENGEKVYTEQWIDGDVDARTDANGTELKPRHPVSFAVHETGDYCMVICDRECRPLFHSEIVFAMYGDFINWSGA